MLRSCALSSLAVLVVCLAAPPAGAEPPTAPTVTGTGSFEIKRQPETLRVQIEVMARGKTLKEALEKLKIRREEVRSALVQLGARKESVALGDPSTADELAGRQADVGRMIRDRNRAIGKAPGNAEAPAIVAGMVRVEFPLPAGGADEFLVASGGLQDKIKTADLGGLKDKGKLTPEEQEAIEEANGRGRRGDEGEARGEPMFLYVSKVTDEERAKAQAGAFARAKRDAEHLARAAGMELGTLHRLTNGFQPGGEFDDPFGRRGFYNPATMLSRPLDGANDDVSEAVGFQPGKVSLRLGLVAEFTLKPPAGK
ncbi:SIMPL domain-containing protein [Gemmata sp.]|uniref:SIMPL domain-containing protein n=1 Tax=Gemmata sp. TaxID=1914242 RepID=UPI003F71969C